MNPIRSDERPDRLVLNAKWACHIDSDVIMCNMIYGDYEPMKTYGVYVVLRAIARTRGVESLTNTVCRSARRLTEEIYNVVETVVEILG